MVDSGSLALGSFNSQLYYFPRIAIFWSGRSNDTCPQQLNGSDELHLLNFGSFTSPHTQISRVNFPGVTDLLPRILSKSTAMILFGTLALSDQYHINSPLTSSLINNRDLLQDFNAFTLCFPLEGSVPRVPYMAPCIHFQINDQDLLILFILLLVQKIPVDITPPVLLDDKRSQITSRLQDFDNSTSPVHTRVKSHALTSRSNGCWSFMLISNGWDLFLSSALPLFC
jgi:hypothetical protein